VIEFVLGCIGVEFVFIVFVDGKLEAGNDGIDILETLEILETGKDIILIYL
jgi:hypothetical protein